MRGKKAKAIRRAMKHIAHLKKIPLDTVYVEQKHPRLVPMRDLVTKEILVNADGTMKTVTIDHITLWLGKCARHLYKGTKKRYKLWKRNMV